MPIIKQGNFIEKSYSEILYNYQWSLFLEYHDF